MTELSEMAALLRENSTMLARLIQQKIPIGSPVKFSLKNGKEISGILVEIGRDYITVENESGKAGILTEFIGAWEVLKEEEPKSIQGSLDAEPTVVKEVHAPQPDQEPKERVLPSPDLQQEVFKKVIAVEAYFNARCQLVKLELKIPDFTFPSDQLTGWQKTDAANVWDRIKNRYEYALKVNELSAKFGRVQPIVNDLKSLIERFPASSHLKRHLAYLTSLTDNNQEALQYYQDAAISSEEACDWFNLAAAALMSGKEELTCYSLGQVFHKVPITEEPETWYVYVNLLKKFNNYSALSKLCETTERRLSEDEIMILSDTAIYLLKATNRENQALDIAQRLFDGQPPKSMILEVFRQLGEQPAESYQQVETEFLRIAKERKEKALPGGLQQPQGLN